MSDDFPITIFHNPACGTSRNTVAMVAAAGYRPQAAWARRTMFAAIASTR